MTVIYPSILSKHQTSIIQIYPNSIHQSSFQLALDHVTGHDRCVCADSGGVDIFYTLDGSKPEAGPRGGAGSSRKYSDSILLQAGRVTIRAVAVARLVLAEGLLGADVSSQHRSVTFMFACSDGRESSVVTKVFFVDPVDNIPQDLQQVITHLPAAEQISYQDHECSGSTEMLFPFQCSSEGTSCPAETSGVFSSSSDQPVNFKLTPACSHFLFPVSSAEDDGKPFPSVRSSFSEQPSGFWDCPCPACFFSPLAVCSLSGVR